MVLLPACEQRGISLPFADESSLWKTWWSFLVSTMVDLRGTLGQVSTSGAKQLQAALAYS